MRVLTALLVLMLLVACGPAPKAPPGGVANGMAIGAGFDATPWTIGQGELQGHALVITYFATW